MKANRIPTPPILVAGLLAALSLLPACGSGGPSEPSGPVTESGQIRIGNRAARACEALVEAAGGEVVAVDFGSGAAGKSISEGDRAGISIVSTSGEPLPEVAGTIRFIGEVKVLQTTCYGADGAALSGDGLSL